MVFSYTTERRRDDLNKKLKRTSGARNRRHLVAVVYAHVDVHTRVARDAGDAARGDEAVSIVLLFRCDVVYHIYILYIDRCPLFLSPKIII